MEVDIARPGESSQNHTRKRRNGTKSKGRGGPGGIFPGVISKVQTVGSGKTHVLRGSAVVTTGKIVRFQEGIIDMTGVGAEYTPFSKTNNLVLSIVPIDGLQQHEHEHANRIAGLRWQTTLASSAKDVTPNETKVYETCKHKGRNREIPGNLPRVAYIQMLQSQGLMHDTYVYSVDMKKSLTTILNPTEIMDGAILSGNCVSACDKNTTYHHLNNPVVHDLFDRHGKDLNFVCVIITNENVYLMDKRTFIRLDR